MYTAEFGLVPGIEPWSGGSQPPILPLNEYQHRWRGPRHSKSHTPAYKTGALPLELEPQNWYG
jgi:hypothetical protein